jgi:hypothetical protein
MFRDLEIFDKLVTELTLTQKEYFMIEYCSEMYGAEYINIVLKGEEEEDFWKNPFAYTNYEDVLEAVIEMLSLDIIYYN